MVSIHYTPSSYGGFSFPENKVNLDKLLSRFNKVIGDPSSRYLLLLRRSNIAINEYDEAVFSDSFSKLQKIGADYLLKRQTRDPLLSYHRYINIIDMTDGSEMYYRDIFEDNGSSWSDDEE